MNAAITVDRHNLRYREGSRELVLEVEWSGVTKTADCPIDFEVFVEALETWTTPPGEPLDASKRDQVLDEISDYYSKAPIADIIGKNGALLRGASSFRFLLRAHPEPSLYYEVGRLLAIPMAPSVGAREWHKKYVADFSGIHEWTEPQSPLNAAHLRLIADRILRKERIGVTGLPQS